MRAAVFSHFDLHGIVDDYVLFSLRCYRQYFDIILFVSTSSLAASEQNKVKRFADVVITRNNIGYDFLSWRIGFEEIYQKTLLDEIFFINDSIYGPCRNIEGLMCASDRSSSDLWGAALNRQFRPHVQSFFMSFKSNLLKSGVAKQFWTSVEPVNDKSLLIFRYEIGLSEFVERQGFSIDALVDLKDLNISNREVVLEENKPEQACVKWEHIKSTILFDSTPNPTQLFWGEMFRRGAPFIKTELLKKNPSGVNISSIIERIRKDKWYQMELINNHLNRVLKVL